MHTDLCFDTGTRTCLTCLMRLCVCLVAAPFAFLDQFYPPAVEEANGIAAKRAASDVKLKKAAEEAAAKQAAEEAAGKKQ